MKYHIFAVMTGILLSCLFGLLGCSSSRNMLLADPSPQFESPPDHQPAIQPEAAAPSTEPVPVMVKPQKVLHYKFMHNVAMPGQAPVDTDFKDTQRQAAYHRENPQTCTNRATRRRIARCVRYNKRHRCDISRTYQPA